ncbi:MAG: hypothetical protein GYB31_06010 [Bacteroidetes bacterium]|nr:hypothetical protein [Bacteroidota bacterium]
MSCAGCTVKLKDGEPLGCRNNGNCSTGGCNRLNTYDWLTVMDVQDVDGYDVVEVSFKNGASKGFFHNPHHTRTTTGDTVAVETGSGYDVGVITLSGELVRLQMKKKKVRQDSVNLSVLRKANERDLERHREARSIEMETMVRSRVIARNLDLDMKIGDVEYQADKRKATFYYTADGRVDFRELIRHYAREFRVKIEMRQIGARQESARIGGMGSCGRELCCSTWLTDFKSVSTTAARYQNLAINQAKLSGQCGRLKCCLNYELDTYMDALEQFPEDVDVLVSEAGRARLVKTDIFKGIMYYAYERDGGRGKAYPLDLERVKEIKAMNTKGEKPTDLVALHMLEAEAPKIDYESVNDVIELPPEERKKRRKKRGGNRNKKGGGSRQSNNGPKNSSSNNNKDGGEKSGRNKRRNKPRRNNKQNKNQGGKDNSDKK